MLVGRQAVTCGYMTCGYGYISFVSGTIHCITTHNRSEHARIVSARNVAHSSTTSTPHLNNGAENGDTSALLPENTGSGGGLAAAQCMARHDTTACHKTEGGRPSAAARHVRSTSTERQCSPPKIAATNNVTVAMGRNVPVMVLQPFGVPIAESQPNTTNTAAKGAHKSPQSHSRGTIPRAQGTLTRDGRADDRSESYPRLVRELLGGDGRQNQRGDGSEERDDEHRTSALQSTQHTDAHAETTRERHGSTTRTCALRYSILIGWCFDTARRPHARYTIRCQSLEQARAACHRRSHAARVAPWDDPTCHRRCTVDVPP